MIVPDFCVTPVIDVLVTLNVVPAIVATRSALVFAVTAYGVIPPAIVEVFTVPAASVDANTIGDGLAFRGELPVSIVATELDSPPVDAVTKYATESTPCME
ncbi:hypothetical protein F6V30_11280 [Oryzomonas sagensis]|uniref:Uncharacterized protein n=1 Tax=Oryzomonas sagensis TaxID=2603857 RepID=A0ABQ6TLR1_9BACT|nr:hypothetical protein [Oryzomonas sagensis]KAB0669389.1 hypothetical protein F6V30_11280 [Oryzomonas sagensis]